MAGIVGLILMGGLNTRMGGSKKALLTYEGKYFYECVADAMRQAGIREIYASVEKVWDMELGIPQITDCYEQIGPLGGITTMAEAVWSGKIYDLRDGMQAADSTEGVVKTYRYTGVSKEAEDVVESYRYAGESKEAEVPDGILVCPCDLPFMRAEVFTRLLQVFYEAKCPVVVSSEGRANPLVAIYTSACLPIMQRQIAEGNYRAGGWMKQTDYVEAVLDGEGQKVLSNINTPEDYRKI